MHSFPPQWEAESWDFFSSAHSLLSRRDNLWHLPAPATPGGSTAGSIRAPTVARQKPVLCGVCWEMWGCWTCEPTPFFLWVKLGDRESLPDWRCTWEGTLPTGFWESGFTFTWDPGTLQIASGFLTKEIFPWIVAELVCLWQEGGSRTSYSTILLTSLLDTCFEWKVFKGSDTS